VITPSNEAAGRGNGLFAKKKTDIICNQRRGKGQNTVSWKSLKRDEDQETGVIIQNQRGGTRFLRHGG